MRFFIDVTIEIAGCTILNSKFISFEGRFLLSLNLILKNLLVEIIILVSLIFFIINNTKKNDMIFSNRHFSHFSFIFNNINTKFAQNDNV